MDIRQQQLQILIIDDSHDDAFALRRAIKKEGFDIHSQRVETPTQLIEAFQQQTWDIVLCDVRMPQLSVSDAIKIVDKHSSTPVSIIIVSGTVDLDEMTKYIRGGVRDFIRKDELSELANVLKRELGYLEAKREQQSEHQRFIEAQKMEAVGTLAGGIAHDFNNILTALMGMQWKLRSDYPDHQKLIDNIDKMDLLCERASKLIKQLLGFARKGIVQMETIELGSFIDEHRSLLQLSIPENIQFHFHKPKEEIYISADPVQLQQMLMNLLNNALDAVQAVQDPEISISIDASATGFSTANNKQQWVALAVLDNGVGMSEETQKHLFEPFYTTKEAGKGTGLGLAMVYGSMISHHGFIDLQQVKHPQQQQVSTSIRLIFPKIQDDHEYDPTAINEQENVKLKPLRILFADDEEMIRELFCALFEDQNSHVDAFEDGLQAWTQFQKTPNAYDIVILDVSMPHMTGPEVARNIRQQSELPIMLISGYDVHETLKLVKGLKHIHVQVKPFLPETLFQDVQALTGGAS